MLKRLWGVFPVVFGVLLLTFALLHLVPGDPVDVMLGESASMADRSALRAALGLNEALPVQFAHYLQQLMHGNFGVSIQTQAPIGQLLLRAYPATLALAIMAMLIGVSIGVPLGIGSALKAGGWQDVLITMFSIRLAAMPAFWLGPVLMLVFAIWLGWLPVSGMDKPSAIVLPALTLGLGLSAILTRMTRTSLLEVLHEDYIRTARAKGLSEHAIMFRHAMRAALLPLVTIIGLQMGGLLAGAVITETIFGWNGVGKLLVESIEKRDYPVTQACVLVIALSYVVVNLCTDLLYRWLDPRTRGSQ